jgi:DNA polymerase-3 subunit gamma/tau
VAPPGTSDEPVTDEMPSTVVGPRAASAPAAALDAAAVRRIWDEVLTMVRRKSPRAAAVVREATVRDVRGDVLVLLFKHPFHAQALASAPELLVDALYEILGGRWQVQCEIAGQSGVVVPASPSPGTTGPARPSSAAPESTPAAVTSPPSTGRRNGRSEAGGARQRGSDGTAPEGASSGRTSTGGADDHAPASGVAKRSGNATTNAGVATTGNATAGGDATIEAVTTVDDDDWPTPATLGGPAPKLDGSERTPSPRPPGSGGQSRATPPVASPATGAAPSRDGTSRAAIAAARAAASGGGSAGSRSGPVGGRRAAGSTPATGTGRTPMSRTGGGRSASPKDDAWPGGNEEPPYDPEFDGPLAAGHVGFDPGDGPDDDPNAGTVRPSSEQQALDLLREALGAEKIAEIDNR